MSTLAIFKGCFYDANREIGLPTIPYLAGMFDIGGGLNVVGNISKRSNLSPIASLNSPHIGFLNQLKAHYGGSISKNPHMTIRYNGHPSHKWIICDSPAIDFLRQIQPYMIIRKDQVGLILFLEGLR